MLRIDTLQPRAVRSVIMFAISLLVIAPSLFAGGPRWATGYPYFTTEGQPIVWYTNQPQYFTDPGDLSIYVNHAAADALVAAAANVWNVSTSSLVLSQGGVLDEHVSGANVYPSISGLVFPSDVQSTNYQSKQIAIIYDYDGSVTDLLLGSGASDPSSCRQNAVTNSVDLISPTGYIQHAIIVLNGRCTGPAPEQQLQMQYQLMRAFGRVLGLAWSQTNDNVFTYSPQPTYNQAMNWPVMHPIDIICGPYTYQCMPQPFTLRADDISALDELYFISQSQAPPGKTDTLLNANQVYGLVTFPTGQGMRGVNVLARRWEWFTATSSEEDWYTISSVSGSLYKRRYATSVTGTDNSAEGSMGTTYNYYEGYYDLARIPMLPGGWQNVIIETEPINPLYTGQYAVGPYTDNTVVPSGSNAPSIDEVLPSYRESGFWISTANSASTCNPGNDGIETAPVPSGATGWWTGLICQDGHTSWSTFSIKANRTFTVEVAAQDEQGFATSQKAMPVIGLWNVSDPTGTLPTFASQTEPFNSPAIGVTSLTAQTTQAAPLRMAIADERGDGRPDYNYQARILYADSISPAQVGAAGGVVTITGTGFRPGNTVTINCVAATVSNWTANTITATAPPLSALGGGTALVADVAVNDLVTGGTTIMSQALTYGAPQPSLVLVSAPLGTVISGVAATTPFSVRAVASDGVTPIPGESITFSASIGSIAFGACGASTCTVSTDASGTASTTVTPLTAGPITLSASGAPGTITASFVAATDVRTLTPVNPLEYIAAQAVTTWPLTATLNDSLAPVAGVSVNWLPASGPISVSPPQSLANSLGTAQAMATAGPLAAGAQASITACAWATVCGTFTAQAVDPASFRLVLISGAGQSVPASETLVPIVLEVTDGASNPVAGASVQIHQTINAWQQACPAHGRCPTTPVNSSSASTVQSDANGLVTITPMQSTGTAEITNIAASAGSQGFVSLSIQKHP
ncbi:hypothetical protein GCM10011507_20060 [Edaphobacter acidisoli]|uniref:IPT/TIG domain-containing protein n=1 Tax=Edaphobacter acidisoli TaxID=2040573 RepID=A0A916W516_9BACT|nr:IPT/TIG domain-containing protein [Edaphobacter acidisoli]GGA68530.1 hypothetical protein GCM10011507_20060 [Edaphobacter acidisoli]